MAALATTVDSYCAGSPQERPLTSKDGLLAAHDGKSYMRPPSPLRSFSGELSDLALNSPGQVLAYLRIHVLTYLSDLEAHLSSLEPTFTTEDLKTKGENTVEEATMWVRESLDMLARIRADVVSHLPEVNGSERVGEFIKSHMPEVPPMHAVRSHLRDLKMSDLRPDLEYIPTLSEHLHSLQSHLTSYELPHALAESVGILKPHATVQELIDLSLAPKFVAPPEGGDGSGNATAEIDKALRLSENGGRLLDYEDLPEAWKNNPFVTQGYRFIPLTEWPRLVMSLFQVHNETLNIHTHFIPFLLWLLTLIPGSPLMSSEVSKHELPEIVFTGFTLLCMFNSALWHTMAGCAEPHSVELSARIDYVGIGWLMCTTLGTIVYYGFQQHLALRDSWLAISVVMMTLSTVFPFMGWFNDVKHRTWRIFFFLCIAFTSFAPMVHLSYLYGTANMFEFMQPVFSSFLAYFIGLLFYAFHFPEAFFTRPGDKHWLDWLGGGSHGIWHLFVVLAITLHRRAIEHLKPGIIV